MENDFLRELNSICKEIEAGGGENGAFLYDRYTILTEEFANDPRVIELSTIVISGSWFAGSFKCFVYDNFIRIFDANWQSMDNEHKEQLLVTVIAQLAEASYEAKFYSSLMRLAVNFLFKLYLENPSRIINFFNNDTGDEFKIPLFLEVLGVIRVFFDDLEQSEDKRRMCYQFQDLLTIILPKAFQRIQIDKIRAPLINIVSFLPVDLLVNSNMFQIFDSIDYDYYDLYAKCLSIYGLTEEIVDVCFAMIYSRFEGQYEFFIEFFEIYREFAIKYYLEEYIVINKELLLQFMNGNCYDYFLRLVNFIEQLDNYECFNELLESIILYVFQSIVNPIELYRSDFGLDELYVQKILKVLLRKLYRMIRDDYDLMGGLNGVDENIDFIFWGFTVIAGSNNEIKQHHLDYLRNEIESYEFLVTKLVLSKQLDFYQYETLVANHFHQIFIQSEYIRLAFKYFNRFLEQDQFYNRYVIDPDDMIKMIIGTTEDLSFLVSYCDLYLKLISEDNLDYLYTHFTMVIRDFYQNNTVDSESDSIIRFCAVGISLMKKFPDPECQFANYLLKCYDISNIGVFSCLLYYFSIKMNSSVYGIFKEQIENVQYSSPLFLLKKKVFIPDLDTKDTDIPIVFNDTEFMKEFFCYIITDQSNEKVLEDLQSFARITLNPNLSLTNILDFLYRISNMIRDILKKNDTTINYLSTLLCLLLALEVYRDIGYFEYVEKAVFTIYEHFYKITNDPTVLISGFFEFFPYLSQYNVDEIFLMLDNKCPIKYIVYEINSMMWNRIEE